MEEFSDKYELIIVGGGPAGASAAIYAARKKIRTLILTKDIGGQSTDAAEIQNWLGIRSISGGEFSKMIREHVGSYTQGTLDLKEDEYVTEINKEDDNKFTIKTKNGGVFVGQAVLVATGGKRKKLNVPGAKEFEHKGITYCATCDAPMFSDRDVAVIGGGNAGLGAALQLLKYAQNVTVLEYQEQLAADSIRIEEFLKSEKAKVIKNAEVTKVEGDKMVTALFYKDRKNEEEKKLNVSGVFVEIGMEPAIEPVQGLLETDSRGYIKVDHRNQQTSLKGIWAAGDCTDSLYKQNIIAAGDGAKAVENIYMNL